MGETETTQKGLDAFATESNGTSDSEKQSGPSASSTQSQSSGPSQLLKDQIEAVNEYISDSFGKKFEQLSGTISPEKMELPIASNIPEPFDVVPNTVGPWTLDFRGEETLTYKTSCSAFDDGYGGGVQLLRMKLINNVRGANRDGKWLVYVESLRGFTNPELIRNADTSDERFLTSVRGHNVKENPGDAGFRSGALIKREDPTEALHWLLTQLCGFRPFAKSTLETDEPPGNWECALKTGTGVGWEQLSPKGWPGNSLCVRADYRGVRFYYRRDESPLPDDRYQEIPTADRVPEAFLESTEDCLISTRLPVAAFPIASGLLEVVP